MSSSSDVLADELDAMAREMLHRSAAWFPRPHSDADRLLAHLAMGLAGEAGEACDEVKKILRDGVYDYTKTHMELADALTYLVMLAAVTGIDWPSVIEAMIAKCETRWGKVDV